MLGNLRLTVKGFFNLSRVIRKTTDKVCDGRFILMPGSGYNPAVLPLCWYGLAAGVVGLEKIHAEDPYTPPSEPPYCRKKVENTISELKRQLKKNWTCFR
jgi:acetoin utilization deacetylase AcuC-like enzyme